MSYKIVFFTGAQNVESNSKIQLIENNVPTLVLLHQRLAKLRSIETTGNKNEEQWLPLLAI